MVFVVDGIVVAIVVRYVVACFIGWFGDGSTNDVRCCVFARVVIVCVFEAYFLSNIVLFASDECGKV